MNDSKKVRARPHVERYVWALGVLWTVIVAASLVWSVINVKQNTLETARIQARVAYEKDIIYRRWNVWHGGVYIPVTEETPPNPYLSDMPERDITTPSGKLLTLVNPAYMTRQVHELTEEEYGVRAHITSLNPIRPENAPDPWETGALQAFERGETEVSSVEETENKEYMRLMRPLITKKGCLKCHAAQGYQEGDIHGGISVSIPMEPLWAIGHMHMLTLLLGHGMLWLIGLAGIGLWTQALRQRESRRKRAEEALRKAHDELEIRVEERTSKLRIVNEQLKAEITERKQAEEKRAKLQTQLHQAEKMEAIGILAGGVAHDLNNILSGLVSYPELLLLDIPKDSPLREPILTIQRSGQKAAAIVQDLLTLARRGVSITEVANLNNIVSEYLSSPEYQKLRDFHPDVKLERDLETNLLNILGSPVHLSKSIMNLVSNAAEAMTEGGEIRISTENRYIDRPIRGYDNVEEGDYVVLTVSDTGVGISTEDIEKIFEPFYTKKKMGRSGTGLGMAVVWGTVKDHKGYIDVQSTEGKGTTFTLYFPITRKEVSRDKSLISIEDYMGKGESILVVDDVEEQREIAYQILKKLGYSVTSVSSGEEAIDYMKNNSADLLILDMIMDPGIDGLETYKRILEFHPGQKAIIASGFSETKRVKEAQRLGAGKYIKKPYTLEKIGIAVKNELS